MVIDEVTPCLRDTQDKIFVNTHYNKIKPISPEAAQKMRKFEFWKFDWSSDRLENCNVYALYAENSKATQGLIACREYRNTGKTKGYIEVVLAEANPANVGKSGRYRGVGAHLFAIACQESFDKGYDGFVTFYSKSELVEHYKEMLHATELFDRHMQLDSEAAAFLVHMYNMKAEEMNRNG